MAPWDDAQTKILEGSVKRFRETAGAKRDEVIAATLGLLEQVALGQLEGLTPEARTTVGRIGRIIVGWAHVSSRLFGSG
ncbi:hypothetical protein EVJ58_g10751 [Rhodofomes roseus]|uniref:Uncharacterized protein n=1 Tax=Rhodofomes roseus TaxID=34475 RepID=A0A4Y9XMV6_9APHY|nr:hypothetical protein EVJ58_g10751 [Rhodofomes roseus]